MIAARGLARLRCSIEARRMLPICIALSLGLHVVLLMIGPPRPSPGQMASAVRAAPRAISVRLMRVPPAASPGAAQATAALSPGLRLDSGNEATAPIDSRADQLAPPPDAGQERHDSLRPAATVQAEPQAIPGAPQDPALRPATDTPATLVVPSLRASDHDDYVPRPLLSVPPVSQAPIIIGAPSDMSEIGRFVGVLSLFIDEQGQVQYVVADKPPLPLAMERSAREAFMAAHFAPGQIDGHAVKSRVRVEVVFDNTPLSTGGARGEARSSSQ